MKVNKFIKMIFQDFKKMSSHSNKKLKSYSKIMICSRWEEKIWLQKNLGTVWVCAVMDIWTHSCFEAWIDFDFRTFHCIFYLLAKISLSKRSCFYASVAQLMGHLEVFICDERIKWAGNVLWLPRTLLIRNILGSTVLLVHFKISLRRKMCVEKQQTLIQKHWRQSF